FGSFLYFSGPGEEHSGAGKQSQVVAKVSTPDDPADDDDALELPLPSAKKSPAPAGKESVIAAVESPTKSNAATPKADPASVSTEPNELGAPVNRTEELTSVPIPLVVNHRFRDLNLDKQRRSILGELRQGTGHRLDFECPDTGLALERVQSA